MRGAPHESWLRPFPVWRILLISVAEETGEQACVGRGCLRVEKIKYFFKWANPDLFLIYLFSSIQTHITNFTPNKYVKNVHQVNGAGIETHNLWNMSLLQ